MEPSADAFTDDRGLLLGVLGGSVTALVGVVGYVLVPLSATEYANGLDVTWEILAYFAQRPLLHHAAVLLVPPFVTTLVAVSIARRWGLDDRWTDTEIVGGIVLVPFVAVWIAMIVAVSAIGATDSPAFVPWALLFGVPLTIIISAIVLAVESTGALGGYVLLEGLRSRPRRAASE